MMNTSKSLPLYCLGARPSKNRKGGSGKRGRVEVYTAKCKELLNLAKPVEFSAEPDTRTNFLSSSAWCLQLSKMKQNAKTAIVRLGFPINAHLNANQKPIGSAPSYRTQCTLPPQPIYQTLLFDFSRVWFRD